MEDGKQGTVNNIDDRNNTTTASSTSTIIANHNNGPPSSIRSIDGSRDNEQGDIIMDHRHQHQSSMNVHNHDAVVTLGTTTIAAAAASVEGNNHSGEGYVRFPSGEISATIIAEENNNHDDLATGGNGNDNVDDETDEAPSYMPPQPQRAEPTLKEKLVERERQARVETERARLKRQFALSNGGVVEEVALGPGDTLLNEEGGKGSVAGTVGDESSIDVRGYSGGMMGEHDDDGNAGEEAKIPHASMHHHHHHHQEAGGTEQQPLGYAMERFLADRIQGSTDGAKRKEDIKNKKPESVVMERFLADPVVVDVTPPMGVSVVSIAEGQEQEKEQQQQQDGNANAAIVHQETKEMVQKDHDNSTSSIIATDGIVTGEQDVQLSGHSVEEDIITNSSSNNIIIPPQDQQGVNDADSELEVAVGSMPRSYSTVSEAGDTSFGPQVSTQDGGDALLDDSVVVVAADSNESQPIARGVTSPVQMDVLATPAHVDVLNNNGGNNNNASGQNEGVGGSTGGVSLPMSLELEEVQVIPSAVGGGGISSLPSLGTEDGLMVHNSEDDNNSNSRGHTSVASSVTDTPPRVLRLTEREIQEMAAIEEASIGNAPPSERSSESFSEVGDMVGELGGGMGGSIGGVMEPHGAFSERTQTTVLESSSMTEDNHSRSIENGAVLSGGATEHSLDDITSASVSSHLVLSPGASSDGESITAMPPSESGEGDDPHHHSDEDDLLVSGESDHDGSFSSRASSASLDEPAPMSAIPNGVSIPPNVSIHDDVDMLDAEASAAANAGVVNRTIRPGMVPQMPALAPLQQRSGSARGASPEPNESGMKKSASTPVLNVDSFDFDKYDDQNPDLLSPRSGMTDSLQNLPHDGELWSPHSKEPPSPLPPIEDGVQSSLVHRRETPFWSPPGKMSVSPLHKSRDTKPAAMRDFTHENCVQSDNTTGYKNYGTSSRRPSSDPRHDIPMPLFVDEAGDHGGERKPLLDDIPASIPRDDSSNHVEDATTPGRTLVDQVDSAFNSVRSNGRVSATETTNNESDTYLAKSAFDRAAPQRFIILCITMLIEIPAVLMISGGSDQLCMLIGRKRYQLLVSFLPLCCAMSGNVGLQANTLTTRAMSHSHVTRASYSKWLQKEIVSALYLGLGMGIIIGGLAYVSSEYDFTFGLTIFLAQVVSISAAGITGTLAPLIFSFMVKRDSSKWGGLLVTAVQDVVGSFAMVVMSYWLLSVLGPHEIKAGDICGH